ncbi:MAG TPA: alpha-L-arabinofuranosidase C-terminal domain-containing protein [Acidobacteriaceae bacterium]|nr:alpha-L-arabinofuranosidase C-terminal domain-containing protein [Acidobacteriaceae bacterium]
MRFSLAKPSFSLLAASLVLHFAAAQTTPALTLTIHADQIEAHASPLLHGLMTEEINHSYDGGLYAELISNSAMHPNDSWGAAIPDWLPVELGDSIASFTSDKTTGPSAALPFSLKLTVTRASASAPAGITNGGYWGIPVSPSTTYRGSFYAKSSDSSGPIHIALVNNNTGFEAAHADVPALTGAWKQYHFTFVSAAETTSSHYRLEITTSRPGTLWFSLITLFPPTYNDRPNGNRIDLMKMLAAMHPTFLRFPGGNYLEGNTIDQRFQWEKTIGPLVDRPTHLSPWGYRSSDGLGLLEFLEWCEDLHMQPVLAVYAGYSLRGQHVAPGPDLAPYVNSALDEIQYVTGSTSTKWGAERARDGHPAPFALKYVEIGNEDWFDKSGSYNDRFAQFYKAIKAMYPQLQLIATTPVTSVKPDVIDEHYYLSAQQFFADAHKYDDADRSGPKIFVGEWATMEGTPTPDFEAALSDAAWMTGMERNSDIVIMASYAPLFVNVNPLAMQWVPDLIGYNALTCYGSPGYYAQAMFGAWHGDQIPQTEQTGVDPRFFYSVTRDSTSGELYIKLVNANSTRQPLQIAIDGAKTINPIAPVVTLSARTPAATNSINHPRNIIPVDSRFERASAKFNYTLPAYSIQVMRIKTK